MNPAWNQKRAGKTDWLMLPRSGRFAAVALTLLVVLTRMPALLMPKAIDDEQVYSVVAIEMLHGGRPYADAVERKPPLLFELYERIFAVAGAYDWRALHVVMVLWTLATMMVLYLTARGLFGTLAGFWAALLYAVFAAWADYRNLALNGELLMNLPVAAAVLVAMVPRASRLRPELLLSGALVAVAFLLKQPSGITALAIGLYLLLPSYRRERGLRWWHSLVHGALLTLGFLVPFALVGWRLQRQGILQAAIYWSVLNHDVPLGPTSWRFWSGAFSRGGFFVLSTLPLWLGAVESVRHRRDALRLWRDRTAELQGLLLLFGVCLIGVSASGQFLYHYFLQLLVPLALLAAPAYARAWEVVDPTRGLPPRPRVAAAWIGLSAVAFLVVDAIGMARHSAPGVAPVWVREHSTESDRMFVWGQGDRFTGFYLDARRRPATRYIASYPLTGHIFGIWDPTYDTSNRIVPGAWDSLQADFARHPPRYIVDTDGLLQAATYPVTRYPYLRDLLSREYRQVHRAKDGVIYERLPGGTPEK